MDFSYAFLEETLSAWPFIVNIILWGFTMRLTWSMAMRWGINHHLIHHLSSTVQIEMTKKDMRIEELERENKKLRDAVDKLWVDNKMIKKGSGKK